MALFSQVVCQVFQLERFKKKNTYAEKRNFESVEQECCPKSLSLLEKYISAHFVPYAVSMQQYFGLFMFFAPVSNHANPRVISEFTDKS